MSTAARDSVGVPGGPDYMRDITKGANKWKIR